MGTGTVTTNHSPLNIRSGPSKSYQVIGSIPKGTTISVTDITNPYGSDIWGVTTYGGVTGSVCIRENGTFWITLKDEGSSKTPSTTATTSSSNTSAKSNGDTLSDIQKDFLEGSDTTVDRYRISSINGSAVQYKNKHYKTEEINTAESYDTVNMSYKKEIVDLKSINQHNEPKFVQNNKNFPTLLGYNTDKYEYDYSMSYDFISNELNKLNKNINIDNGSRETTHHLMSTYYNRFKVPMPNSVLAKSTAHVFFIRPDLNIYNYDGGKNYSLPELLKNNASFYYTSMHSPDILKNLIHDNEYGHDFSMMLSNHVISFEISDEYIGTDTYGTSYLGHKIPFGKYDAESKAQGTLNITFHDDRDLSIYHLHKIWTEYIAGVYRGTIKSKSKYIKEKILDYVSAIYYILTAENGEDIIFWSKYYGVFPTNSPSSGFSYNKDSTVKNPECTINYTYAFKEDFNPLTLVEFNMHSKRESVYKYAKTYEPSLLGTGQTWVGAPFVETFNNSKETPYTFKLRFRKK